MKKNLFATVVVSTLFYTTSLLTMFVLPLFLSARHDTTTVLHRYLDRPHQGSTHPGYLRMPGTDGSRGAPAARQVPIDSAIPDAKMIARPAAKMRLRTLKA
jgi:hypothetical protein